MKTRTTVMVIIMADGAPASKLPDFFAIQRYAHRTGKEMKMT